MDTNKLRHFIALAESQNLRRAAEILRMSHSGVLKSVKSLESELDTDLFVKDGRESRLTEQGKILLKEARTIFDAEKNLISSVNGTAKAKPVTIATFEVFSTYFAPTLSRLFLNEEFQLQFREAGLGEMERLVLNESADFAITYSPVPTQGLEHMPIGTIESQTFMRAKSQFSGRDYSELPFVAPMADAVDIPNRVVGLDGWPDDKRNRNIKFRVSLMETALSLCREDIAVGYFPNFVISMHNQKIRPEFQLVPYKCAKPVITKQRVYLVKRLNQKENAVIKKIAREIRKLEN